MVVKFIVCSDSDIPRDSITKYGIDLLPLIVELDGVQYRAYRDISGEEFRDLLRKSKGFPKTATVSYVEIADKIRNHIENGDEVIVVTMSGVVSGTFNLIRLAKEQLEEEFGRELPISAVDSMNFSIAYLHPVYDAVKMANNGRPRQEIVAALNIAYAKQHFLIMMMDISFLKRGGRIKPGTAFIGGALGIVPILDVKDGLLEPVRKERGTTRAIESILHIMEQRCPSKKLRRVQLVQCSREMETKVFESLIKERFEVEEFLPLTSPEASVTAHSGMDLIGVAFTESENNGGAE